MNSFGKAITQRVFHRNGTAGDLAKLPAAYRNAGGGLMSRIASAAILRLALRWPAFAVILMLSMVVARLMPGRSQRYRDSPRPAASLIARLIAKRREQGECARNDGRRHTAGAGRGSAPAPQ